MCTTPYFPLFHVAVTLPRFTPDLSKPFAERAGDLLPSDQRHHPIGDHSLLALALTLGGFEGLDEFARGGPSALDLERLLARYPPRAHEHLQEHVAQGEHVGLGRQRGEGREGDAVGCRGGGRRIGGAEIVQRREVGLGRGELGTGDEGDRGSAYTAAAAARRGFVHLPQQKGHPR